MEFRNVQTARVGIAMPIRASRQVVQKVTILPPESVMQPIGVVSTLGNWSEALIDNLRLAWYYVLV
jgi:hypothetical protein